ncbi:hypothetical protein [Providencia rettgeri]|uniref:hypothetical protein n=1 Tax=Providencia rettgeri TaxID=587 RepID=UPI0025727F78|nr:hypothetical protein [Providencia rettgeri]MDL9983984.1 hypothetical protein [Providencia rettgeri]
MISGQLNQRQFNTLQEALKRFDLPPKKRQRLLWRIAKYGVIAAAKRNVRNQQTPEGEPWPQRQGNWRKKMLRNMPKVLHIKELPETESVRIYLKGGKYRNGKKQIPAGVVGYSQQHGINVTVNKSSFKSGRDKTRPATKKQAKKLRALGYKERKGKGWRKPPVKAIESGMSFAKAGLLIRTLSDETPQNSWVIDVPAREFLGINQDEFEKALARQLQGIGFG